MKKVLLFIASILCYTSTVKAQITVDKVLITNYTSNDLYYNTVVGCSDICVWRIANAGAFVPITPGMSAVYGVNFYSGVPTHLGVPDISGTTGFGILKGFGLRISDVGYTHLFCEETSFTTSSSVPCPLGGFPSINTLGVTVNYSVVGTELHIDIL
jgi:hypothetical protein